MNFVNIIASHILQESIEDEATIVEADASPVVVPEDDLRLRQIFPVFQSGLRSIDQPITFLRPDQVWM